MATTPYELDNLRNKHFQGRKDFWEEGKMVKISKLMDPTTVPNIFNYMGNYMNVEVGNLLSFSNILLDCLKFKALG